MGNPEIKNRFTGNIIIPAGKYASIKEAVEKEYQIYGNEKKLRVKVCEVI